MMQSSSPGTASETWAQTGTTRTRLQPDSDWSCRANCGFELAFRLINDLPALSQLGLGHASSVHVLHPCVGVVRTPMKALERNEVKVGYFSLECRA